MLKETTKEATVISKMDDQTFKEMISVLKNISDGVATLNEASDKQKTEKIKEKTKTEKPIDQTSVVDKPDETEKQLSFLRKTFQEAFTNFKDVLSPGGILKGFGMISGSPMFMLIGDKLNDLIGSYADYRNEQKEQNKLNLAKQEESTKNDFLNEQYQDEAIARQEKTNELLQEIVDKPFEVKKEKDGGLMDIIKAPLSLFSKLLPGKLASVFASTGMLKVFSKLFGGGKLLGGGLLGGLGKIGGLLKGGGKLLGKLALPLTIAMSGIDFFSGFRNAFEITGRDDLSAKIQAGLSEAISGFTFGLVDPKTVSKSIDMVNQKMAKIFWDSVDYIKCAFEGKVDVISDISDILSKVSFNLFSKEDIEGGLKLINSKLKGFFESPFILFKDLTSGKNILESVDDFINNISFGIINAENIEKSLGFVVDKIKDILTKPIDYFRKLFNPSTAMETINKTLSAVTFGMFSESEIGNIINTAVDKIKDVVFRPFKLLKDIWDNNKDSLIDSIMGVYDKFSPIIDSITNVFDSVSDGLKKFIDNISDVVLSRYEDIKNKIDFVKKSISDPFNYIKERFFGADDIEDIKQQKNIYSGKIDKDNPIEIFSNENKSINTVKRENTITNRIKYEKEQIRKREEAKDKNRISNEKPNNILSNSVNNNIFPQESLTVKNDDPSWNAFQLNY